MTRIYRTPEEAWASEKLRDATEPVSDNVNHPKHYTAHPSGVECITITEHMGFNLGNAFKYIWRADLKNDALEDLEKARWYLDREIAKRRAGAPKDATGSLVNVCFHGQPLTAFCAACDRDRP